MDNATPPVSGTLSVVATPIGNLEDITLRALRVLKEADVIFCEDTRVTRKLLDRYEIKTQLRRLDANTELVGAEEVVKRLEAGESVAYVSDAGTPTISDPGYRLVAYVREIAAANDNLEVTIEAIPGPSALVAALSIAGVPADQFVFLGFPPHKKGRLTLMKAIAAEDRTVVLYESSHRILKLLEEMSLHIPQRSVSIVREITKKFEELRTGSPSELHDFLNAHAEHQKGEFVVIVGARN